MKKRCLSLLFGALISAQAAWAFDPFTVKSIKVEGLQRVSEGTVFNYLPFQIGDTIAEDQTSDIVHALFNTGFFQDVQLARDDDALIIIVVERPVVGEIKLSGNTEIKSKELLELLKDAGLAEGRTFDRALLSRIRNELERIYFSRGKYGVEVETTVLDKARNRVEVNIDITEGQVAKIKDINIIGNEVFSDDELREEFTLSETGWLSWFSSDDRYAKHRLEADIESVQSFYLDRGYLNVDVTSTQVSMTPNKQDIYITININEGSQYTLSEVQLSGDYILPEAEMLPLVTLAPGEVFSRRKITSVIKALSDRLGSKGYAFAQIHPMPVVNEQENTVAINFVVDPGRRYYVNQIHFNGNTKTQDRVLRREMVQLEGAILSTTEVDASKRHLDQTGYFQDVSVNTRPIGGDMVDIDWDIEEASSGHITGGLGYSSAEGILFHGSISNRNFMGLGESVELDFNHSESFKTYSMGYNNPYYTINGISRGVNLFYSKTEPGDSSDVSEYFIDSVGLNVNYGVPLSKSSRMSFGGGLRSTKLHTGTVVPDEINRFVLDNKKDLFEANLTAGWSYNTLDRYVFPTEGLKHGISGLIAMPGSDLQYYRLSYNTQWFKPLFNDLVLSLSGSAAYGDGYGSTDVLPFFQNFFVGGGRTVRGFEESSLGPKDSLGNPFGGNLMLTGSAQLSLTRFFGDEFKSIRPGAFVDLGQVYTTADRITTSTGDIISQNNPAGVRASAGLAMTWLSPMGPLEFSLGFPLNKKEGDETKPFNFSIGTLF